MKTTPFEMVFIIREESFYTILSKKMSWGQPRKPEADGAFTSSLT